MPDQPDPTTLDPVAEALKGVHEAAFDAERSVREAQRGLTRLGMRLKKLAEATGDREAS